MRDHFRQLISFGLVGLVNTGLSLGLIFSLLGLGVAFAVANLLGYSFGLLFSFSVNRRLTFRSSGHHFTELPRFIAIYGLSYAIQLSAATALQQNNICSATYATIIGAALFALLSFCGCRWLVFRTLDNDKSR